MNLDTKIRETLEASLLNCLGRKYSRFVLKLLSLPLSFLNFFVFRKRIYLDYVVFSVTEFCSLRCRKCAAFLPYFPNACHFDLDVLKKDIDSLCSLIVEIKKLNITGGEPLLYPDLAEFIDYVARKKEIKQIVMITNGTIIPSSKVIQSLSKAHAHVEISFYGEKSIHLGAVISAFATAHIPITVSSQPWFDLAMHQEKNLDFAQLRGNYARCAITECRTVINGNFFLCPVSANGSEAKILNAEPSDFVSLRFDKVEYKKKRAELSLLLRKKYVSACAYCNGIHAESPRCDRAEQLPCDYVKEDAWKYI